MSRLAIVDPDSLLCKELQEALESRADLCSELKLLTTTEEDVGVLTEVQGAAAIVQKFEPDALAGLDLVFVGGDSDTVRLTLEEIPDELPVVVAWPDVDPSIATPKVAGMGEPPKNRRVSNPHPAVVPVAHLLDSLREVAPRDATATVILPASTRDQAGLDELLAQTRSLITFSGERTEDVFGHQLAFNLFPASYGEETHAQLRASIGDHPKVSVQLLQGGCFHGLGISLSLTVESDPGVEAIREIMAGDARLESATEPGTLGPIDSATSHRIVVGDVTLGAGDRYWIWAVADNLSYGGALNAVALAEELLST